MIAPVVQPVREGLLLRTAHRFLSLSASLRAVAGGNPRTHRCHQLADRYQRAADYLLRRLGR